MSFMQMQIVQKGATYSADCRKCGATHTVHEWITDDFNGDRDAMQEGKACCPECGGLLDPETFSKGPRMYAGRYSAPGYTDCTEWTFDANRRRLARCLREMYGD